MVLVPTKAAGGASLPLIGLGTWRFGEDDDRRADDVKAVRRAVEAGIQHIDTAELYGHGRTELLLREALAPYDRAELFIASKAMPSHAAPDDVVVACHRSLDRLGMDYLDLYMPHARNLDIPLDETMAAFDSLVDEGLVRHIGLSNFGATSVREAQRVTQHPIVADQVHYNLGVRAPEDDGLLAHCQDNDVLLNAWRPVKRSYSADGTILDASSDQTVLATLATKYDKTPLQVAVNWLISQRNVVTMIKTSSELHLQENLGALGWTLADDDIELLRTQLTDRNEPDVPLL